MSMGIMGISPIFANAAGRRGKKAGENKILLHFNQADATIYKLSCANDIVIETIKDGELLSTPYQSLSETQISLQNDADTDVVIRGDVTLLKIDPVGPPPGLVSADLSSAKTIIEVYLNDQTNLETVNIEGAISLKKLKVQPKFTVTEMEFNNQSLEDLNIDYTGLQSLDARNLPSLQSLSAQYGGNPNDANLKTLDLANCINLSSLILSGQTKLISISYPATNENVSTAVAEAITHATSTTGTVYTDSAATYYSTIADAATAKGWTIAQIPE